MTKYICSIFLMLATVLTAQENTIWRSGRPDGHAPISVMGDHTHGKDEWMFSYRFMSMQMDDLASGSETISNSEVHNQGYMATPEKMQMNMHMLGVMYAPSNKITVMVMASVLQNDMDLQMRNISTGMLIPFSTESSGFGDIKISGLYRIFNKNSQTLHTQLGISLPTGSINEKDSTPMSNGQEVILPYPMQIGTGTLDTNVGLTYLGQCHTLSWGHQLKGTFRLGKNSNEYRLGNQYSLNNWLALKTTDWISFSARLEGIIISKITGAHPDLNPMMVTTANTSNSGGSYINTALGLNTYIPNGTFKNIRIGLEYGIPVYQDVNGIQLKNKQSLTLGLQYSL